MKTYTITLNYGDGSNRTQTLEAESLDQAKLKAVLNMSDINSITEEG